MDEPKWTKITIRAERDDGSVTEFEVIEPEMVGWDIGYPEPDVYFDDNAMAGAAHWDAPTYTVRVKPFRHPLRARITPPGAPELRT